MLCCIDYFTVKQYLKNFITVIESKPYKQHTFSSDSEWENLEEQ